MAEPITVVLVEDHPALRKGMEILLGRHGHVIAGAVGDAATAYDMITRVRPDVAVIDISLPRENGAELSRRLSAENHDLPILLYTGIEDSATLQQALDCGASGFALKAGAPEELTAAIRTLAEGGTYMDPRLGALLARPAAERMHTLTRREREVLDLLAQGLTGAAVAERLFLSPDTVRTHVRNAMEKLQARTRVQAVVLAMHQRAIDVDPANSDSHAAAAPARRAPVRTGFPRL